MELIVIGSGTGALSAKRGPSGYVVLVNGETWLVDGGTGTLRKCLEAGISYRDIDRVFYTHLHPDHTIDLVPLLFATRHTPGFARTRPLRFYGPRGFKKFFKTFTDLFGTGITDVEYEIEVMELSEDRFSVNGVSVQTALMAHSKGAIGYRWEWQGKTLVYSGDTDYCEAVVDLAQRADVLVLECSFPDDQKVAGHLTPSDAGRIAALAEAKQLVLTHFYGPCEAVDVIAACRAFYSGTVIKAWDLMRVSV